MLNLVLTFFTPPTTFWIIVSQRILRSLLLPKWWLYLLLKGQRITYPFLILLAFSSSVWYQPAASQLGPVRPGHKYGNIYTITFGQVKVPFDLPSSLFCSLSWLFSSSQCKQASCFLLSCFSCPLFLNYEQADRRTGGQAGRQADRQTYSGDVWCFHVQGLVLSHHLQTGKIIRAAEFLPIG